MSFGIDHLIGAVSCKKARVNISCGSCHDVLRAEILEKRRGLQGTLEVVADRDNAYIIIADAEGLHKISARTIANKAVRNIGKNSVDPVFAHIDGHDLVP